MYSTFFRKSQMEWARTQSSPSASTLDGGKPANVFIIGIGKQGLEMIWTVIGPLGLTPRTAGSSLSTPFMPARGAEDPACTHDRNHHTATGGEMASLESGTERRAARTVERFVRRLAHGFACRRCFRMQTVKESARGADGSEGVSLVPVAARWAGT